MRRTHTALGALALLFSLGAQAEPPGQCPPVAQPPSAEQAAEAQRQAKDRGALWRISKDGRTSYLYGTIHIGRLAWIFPGPNLQQALRETQVLAVEIDILAPDLAARAQAAQQRALRWTLSEAEQRQLDAAADAACVPRAAFAHLHPTMQGITHIVLAGRHEGLDPAFGQEPNLLAFARATQRTVVSLESIESQLEVVLPKTEGEGREGLRRMLVDLEAGRARAQLKRLGDAWERGDLDLAGSLEKLCDCLPTEAERAFSRRINDERNPGLADRIAEEHAKGKPLLAAVGLLHMTGSKALPDLLKARGFAVERIRY